MINHVYCERESIHQFLTITFMLTMSYVSLLVFVAWLVPFWLIRGNGWGEGAEREGRTHNYD